MLTVLLESQVRHQRRIGGMTLSVAAHIAIIAAVTATTVRGTPVARERVKPIPLMVRPAITHRSEQRREHPRQSSHRPTPLTLAPIPTPNIDHLRAPDWKEPLLPSPVAAVREGLDHARIAIGASGGAPGPRSVIDGDDGIDSSAWRGNELLMRIVASSTPQYPPVLRRAGIDGRVLVRFVVDTTGRIDTSSVRVLKSTHDLFTRAVRDALTGFRFRPAEVGRRRVAALAEMPFEFRITR